ncbi:MAG: zinc metalloprotease [Phycisphaerales bacterium]|nr:zinc metalloprotease [Phycisphaerales bacterium]
MHYMKTGKFRRLPSGKSLWAHCLVAGVCLCAANFSRGAADVEMPVQVEFAENGEVHVDGLVFNSPLEYFQSEFFQTSGMRCATLRGTQQGVARGSSAADCQIGFTNPDAVYDPSVVKYRIPVVVHVIRAANGVTGNISEAMVQSQIDVLNEDFQALPGSNGAPGTDVQIEFFLATEDPGGNPTNGITYTNNSTWFNDSGTYYNTLAWDTDRYLNIYTNQAGGALGYVPSLPQGGIVGLNQDRVVIYYQSFGRNSPFTPYHLGRTTTHEVGHYLGLEHTFASGGCPTATSPACHSNGDWICDTPAETTARFGCSNNFSCGTADPVHNYMDYTDDICMWEFTAEQARRIRCTLENYRPNLYTVAAICGPGSGAGDCPFGDFDHDGDVDKADHILFVDCLGGPDTSATPTPPLSRAECYAAFDSDGDNDIDLQDFEALQISSGQF